MGEGSFMPEKWGIGPSSPINGSFLTRETCSRCRLMGWFRPLRRFPCGRTTTTRTKRDESGSELTGEQTVNVESEGVVGELEEVRC
jgi:hypothetical protein